MNSRFSFLALAILLLLLCSSIAQADYAQIIDAFTNDSTGIRNQTVFPVKKLPTDTNVGFDYIVYTLGPRNLNGAYDFHRGSDINSSNQNSGGNDVVAAYDGEFKAWTQSGGNGVIMLRHKFPDPVTYGPNSQSYSYFYTRYEHLAITETEMWVNSKGWINDSYTSIAKGDKIGILGNSGASMYHLHFELRVCSPNSWESSPSQGFDPAISSLLMFKPNDPVLNPSLDQNSSLYVQTLSMISPAELNDLDPVFTEAKLASPDDQIVLYTSSMDELAALNNIKVSILDTNTGLQVVKSHELDLNQRIGFDATTNAALDIPDKTKPYLDPVSFKLSDTEYRIAIVVPASWLVGFFDSHYQLKVVAMDLWSNSAAQVSDIIASPGRPSIFIMGKKKIVTTASMRRIRGTTKGIVAKVTYRVGKHRARNARGTSIWSFKVKLKSGKNKTLVVAEGPVGISVPAKIIVIRK